LCRSQRPAATHTGIWASAFGAAKHRRDSDSAPPSERRLRARLRVPTPSADSERDSGLASERWLRARPSAPPPSTGSELDSRPASEHRLRARLAPPPSAGSEPDSAPRLRVSTPSLQADSGCRLGASTQGSRLGASTRSAASERLLQAPPPCRHYVPLPASSLSRQHASLRPVRYHG
jgi:hypothetical protein